MRDNFSTAEIRHLPFLVQTLCIYCPKSVIKRSIHCTFAHPLISILSMILFFRSKANIVYAIGMEQPFQNSEYSNLSGFWAMPILWLKSSLPGSL